MPSTRRQNMRRPTNTKGMGHATWIPPLPLDIHSSYIHKHKTNTDACSFTGVGRLACRGSMIHFSMIVIYGVNEVCASVWAGGRAQKSLKDSIVKEHVSGIVG